MGGRTLQTQFVCVSCVCVGVGVCVSCVCVGVGVCVSCVYVGVCVCGRITKTSPTLSSTT